MGGRHMCDCCVRFHPRWQPSVTKREEQLRSQNWPWHTMLSSKCTQRKAAPGRCKRRWASVVLRCRTSWVCVQGEIPTTVVGPDRRHGRTARARCLHIFFATHRLRFKKLESLAQLQQDLGDCCPNWTWPLKGLTGSVREKQQDLDYLKRLYILRYI